jgi:hypothetical protein
MTDNRIDKVRAEIERRLEELNPKKGEIMGRPLRDVNPRTFPRESELEKLLSFIDSMQEEPTAKEYLCIKDFYPYEKGKVYKSIDGGFPANAKEYFKLVEEPSTSVWHDASEIPKFRKEFLAIVYTPTDVLKYVKTIYSEDEYCLTENDKWAYIDDILKL